MNRLTCSLLAILLCATGASAQETAVRARITAAVNAIRLVDTHEHLPPEADRVKKPRSLFSLLHYVSSDMWADGMDRDVGDRRLGDPSVPLAKQWELIAAGRLVRACGAVP